MIASQIFSQFSSEGFRDHAAPKLLFQAAKAEVLNLHEFVEAIV
jgi:3'-phosphoadenosine 5'-phosphosulfate (PAPS) 3'-phosphatase